MLGKLITVCWTCIFCTAITISFAVVKAHANVEKENLFPFVRFESNNYYPQQGESVTLTWTSKGFSEVSLTSSLGESEKVSLSGKKNILFVEPLAYVLKAQNTSGESLEVQIFLGEKDNQLAGLADAAPKIQSFNISFEPGITKTKAMISWSTENAESVILNILEYDIGPKGYLELYIEHDTIFELIATNGSGKSDSEYSFVRNESLIYRVDLFVPFLLGTTIYLLGIIFFVANPLNPVVTLLRIITAFKKHNNYLSFGYVYDQSRLKPIPFATIDFIKQDKLVSSQIADTYGLFRIPQTQIDVLKIKAFGFEELVMDLAIKPNSQSQVAVIAELVSKPQTVGKLAKWRFINRVVGFSLFRNIARFFFILGFAYSLFWLALYPNLQFLITFIVYMCISLYGYTRIRKSFYIKTGRVVDSRKRPESFTSVAFFKGDELKRVFTTNLFGVFEGYLDKGLYTVMLFRKGVNYYNYNNISRSLAVGNSRYFEKDFINKN